MSPSEPPPRDEDAGQQHARNHYEELRRTLVRLSAAPVPDQGAIDATVKALEQAQLAYKAEHGLMGNNPMDD